MLNNFANKITNNQTKNEELLFSIGSKIINNFLINSSITNKDYYITDIEFYISSSIHTIDKDITTNLKKINTELYYKAKEILDINRNERHIRGGEATRRKYRKDNLSNDR